MLCSYRPKPVTPRVPSLHIHTPPEPNPRRLSRIMLYTWRSTILAALCLSSSFFSKNHAVVVSSFSLTTTRRRQHNALPNTDTAQQRHALYSTKETSEFTSTGPELTAKQKSKRRELLSETNEPGNFFSFDRSSGRVSFGSTVVLSTQLTSTKGQVKKIEQFVKDLKPLSASIWDPSLLKDLGGSVFEVQTMNLQFVSIKLAPTVTMYLWTQDGDEKYPSVPVFKIQSIDFDPNISILPGVGVTAESLGLEICVVGELRPSRNGQGVTGTVSFETSGRLQPPLNLLPKAALEQAANSISTTISQFASQNFQTNCVQQYRQFVAERQRNQEEESLN